MYFGGKGPGPQSVPLEEVPTRDGAVETTTLIYIVSLCVNGPSSSSTTLILSRETPLFRYPSDDTYTVLDVPSRGSGVSLETRRTKTGAKCTLYRLQVYFSKGVLVRRFILSDLRVRSRVQGRWLSVVGVPEVGSAQGATLGPRLGGSEEITKRRPGPSANG